MTCETNCIGQDNLQLIDFSKEDDYLIAFPFRDSLEDLRLSVTFNDINECDGMKFIGGANSKVLDRIDHVQSESVEPRRPSFLRKSLAWDSAFFTSPGVLNPEELFMINKGFKRPESNKPSPGARNDAGPHQEQTSSVGDGFHLETLEGDLFEDTHKLSKRSKVATDIASFSQANADSCNKMNIRSQKKVRSVGAPKRQSLNLQGSKRVAKTSMSESKVVQEKVSSNPKLISSRKAAIEGSDNAKLENKTRKAGMVPESSMSKGSRWGDLSGLPKATSFTSPATQKDSRVHGSYGSSSSVSSSMSSSKFIRRKNRKLTASVQFSLTSTCSSSTSPASSIDNDGCFSKSFSSTFTTHENPANVIPKEGENGCGGPKRKMNTSRLRMPSPKIGFFDEEQPLEPSYRGIISRGQSNENNLSPSEIRKSLNVGRKVRKVKPKEIDNGKKKQDEEVNGLSRWLEAIDLNSGQQLLNPTPCSRTPLAEIQDIVIIDMNPSLKVNITKDEEVLLSKSQLLIINQECQYLKLTTVISSQKSSLKSKKVDTKLVNYYKGKQGRAKGVQSGSTARGLDSLGDLEK